MKFEHDFNEYDVEIKESTYKDGSLRIDLIDTKTKEKLFELTKYIDKPHDPRTAYVALNEFGAFIENYHLGTILNDIVLLRDACGWFCLVKFNQFYTS